jgi:hypothetical protein
MAKMPKWVTLRDRYEIAIDEPLSQYDNPPALAFKVRHKKDASRDLIALVCDPKLPTRFNLISEVNGMDVPYLLSFQDWGVIEWPPEGRRCPVLIYARPGGVRVMSSLDDEIEPMRESEVFERFANPLYQAMRDFNERDLVHRAIRPNNLYYTQAEGGPLMLGECVSSPPAMAQPFVYETIESCMCDPAGRGLGSSADDLYALGVTLLAVLTGRSPCRGMSDDEVLDAKISMGSYGALTQESRISLTMMEPLRGLLSDNAEDRWTVEDLGLWANGRRGSPIQQSMAIRASRSFVFMDKEHFTCRDLAHTMSRNWAASIGIIRDGAIDMWLRRALGDKIIVTAMNAAKSVVAEADNDDNLIGRCCIALDPAAPIRYRNLRATVEGIPNILALYGENSDAREDFSQLERHGLIEFWDQSQPHPRLEFITLYRDLKRARDVMARSSSGEGIERAIYDLNPSLACQSPLVQAYYVLNAGQLLPALDRLAEETGDAVVLIDDHIAAYIAAHFTSHRDSELRDLDNQVDPYLPILAAVRLLSRIQEKAPKLRPYPKLGLLAAKLLEPTVKRYFNRKTREKVSKAMRDAGATGQFSELLAVADNPRVVNNDERRFEFAVAEYRDLEGRLLRLDADNTNRTAIARELGAQVSSVLSGMLSTVALLGIVLFAFLTSA